MYVLICFVYIGTHRETCQLLYGCNELNYNNNVFIYIEITVKAKTYMET